MILLSIQYLEYAGEIKKGKKKLQRKTEIFFGNLMEKIKKKIWEK